VRWTLTLHCIEIGKVFATSERKHEVKIVILIARILLGLIFVVFGLNGFLNFLSMGPMPTGLAGQFVGALVLSHYFWVVAALQIAGGALLIASRFVPLALVLLGPVIVNIICYHVFLNPSGAVPAVVVTVLWLIVFYGNRQHFSGIFEQRT
jgi:putative oxidoreductase